MNRTEPVELTVLCLIEKGDEILLQNRVKEDWKGYTLPGGHVELGESFVDAAIREVKEEAGIEIKNPRIVGIKQFPGAEGRYIVILFKATKWTGVVSASNEGEMEWVRYDQISNKETVADFEELLSVFNNPKFSEFQYLIEESDWKVSIK